MIILKGYISAVLRAIELEFENKLITLKYIIGTYFDSKLSMFGLAASAKKEKAKGPRMGRRAVGAKGSHSPPQEGHRAPQTSSIIYSKVICNNIVEGIYRKDGLNITCITTFIWKCKY